MRTPSLTLRFAALLGIAAAWAAPVRAEWQDVATISSTLGNNAYRVCVGGSGSDLGCPVGAPLLDMGANRLTIPGDLRVVGNLLVSGSQSFDGVTFANGGVSATGTISATGFAGDGSGLTGIDFSANPIDRITSGTAAVIAQQGGTVGLTLGGTPNAAYFHPTLGFVGPGISTTGPISGTSGYFNGNVGINAASNSNYGLLVANASGGIIHLQRTGTNANRWSFNITSNATDGIDIGSLMMDAQTLSAGVGVRDINNIVTWYAKASTGNVYVPSGKFAIGLSPTVLPSTSLHVNGTLRIANGGESCDTNRTGAIKYESGQFQICRNGATWETLVAGASGNIDTDRITSSSQAGVIANSTGYVSLTTGGVTGTAYFTPAGVLVNAGVSTTGPVSATNGYFTGNVGIGRTPTTAALEISATGGANNAQVSIGGGAGGAAGKMVFRRGNDGSAQGVIGYATPTEFSQFIIGSNGGGGYLSLVAATYEKMRITKDGIGVSTTAPTTGLHVNGTLRIADGAEACDANRLGALKYASNQFYICQNIATGWESLATTSSNTTVAINTGLSGSIVFRDEFGILKARNDFSVSATTGSIGIGAGAPAIMGNNGLYATGNIYSAAQVYGGTGVAAANNYGIGWGNSVYLLGDTTTNYMAAFTSGAEALRITSSGHVGIGTTTPSTTLHVNGTLRIADGAEVCDANRLGALKYASNQFYICRNGTTWETLVAGGSGTMDTDRITSSSQAGVIANSTGYISLTTGGVTGTAYFDPIGVLTNAGLNSTGGVSATTGYFDGNVLLKGTTSADSRNITIRGGGSASMSIYSYGNTNPIISAYRTSGTEAVPVTVNANNTLLTLAAYGYNGSSYPNNAAIRMYAGENVNDGRIAFLTRSAGNTVARMHINPYGLVIIGSAVQSVEPSTSLQVQGSIRMAAETSTTLQTCDTNRTGAMKYESGNFYVCRNGTTWETLVAGGSGTMDTDRITSGTTAVVANTSGNTISFTTAGTTTAYFNPAGVLINSGISATETVSATRGYIATYLGVGQSPMVGYSIYAAQGIRTNTSFQASSGNELYPAYTFANSNNTGLFLPSAGNVAITANGSEVVRITSTGYVGIGTASPSSSLHVSGTLRIANGGESCDADRTGAIRFTAGQFQVCRNGTTWETLVAGASGTAETDRITSGTTAVIANTNGDTVSVTTGGTTTSYFHSTLGLVTPGVSATGTVSSAEVNTGRVILRGVAGSAGVSLSNPGDNLGNHTATQNLDMGGFDITNAGNIAATSFTGDGSGLTNISASAITGLNLDRITSGTTSVTANTNGNTISFTTAGTTTAYINSAGRFIGSGAYFGGGDNFGSAGDYIASVDGDFGILGGSSIQFNAGGVRTWVNPNGFWTNEGSTRTYYIGGDSGAILGVNTYQPSTTLHVSGTLRIANGGESCDADRTGAIRFTAGQFQVCRNGTTWETLVAGASGTAETDRITSGTTSVTANTDGDTVSITTAGTTTSYFHSTLGLVTPGVSATGPISGTRGYFDGELRATGDVYGSRYFGWELWLDNDGFLHWSNDTYIVGNGITHELKFGANNTDAMIITSNSYVGIGTLTPTAELEVNGTISATNITLNGQPLASALSSDRITSGTTSMITYNDSSATIATAGVERLVVGTNGNIGIGQQPTTGFALNISGSTTVNDGYLSINSGLGNVAIGQNAIFATTGASAAYLRNRTAVGSYAGSNALGAGLVAIGANAGTSSSGLSSVYIGYNTGSYNSGSHAISLGAGAGVSNTGTNLIAIGAFSGQSNPYDDVVLLGASTRANKNNQVVLGSIATVEVSTTGILTARGLKVADYFAEACDASHQGALKYESGNFMVCRNGTTWETLVAGASGTAETDRITSGTTSVAANTDGNTVSITTAGTTTSYFHGTLGLVAPGISATGTVSGAQVYTPLLRLAGVSSSGGISLTNSSDNLGTHTATQNLDMASFNIINVGTISGTFVGDGSGLTNLSVSGDRIISGTSNIVVNTSTSTVSFTLGGVTVGYLHPTLGLVGPGVSTTGTISGTTVATPVLQLIGVTGSAGVSMTSGGGSADNLGDHTATQALNMGGFNITSVGNISASGSIQPGNADTSCSSAADYGKMRFNPATSKMFMCRP